MDTIRGRHANQHIPQITGALAIYDATHDPRYYQIADNFWHVCRNSYTYAIGGVAGARNPSNPECFTAEPDSLFRNGFHRGGQNEACGNIDPIELIFRDKTVTGFYLGKWLQSRGFLSALRATSRVQRLLIEGRIETKVQRAVRLDEAVGALQQYASHMTQGKILLSPHIR